MSAAPDVSNERTMDRLDEVLVASPFGDHVYITRQMHVAFRRRLKKVAAHQAGAADLAAALAPDSEWGVLGDMVVRSAVQHAHRQVETGQPYGMPLDLCDEVLATVARQVRAGVHGPLASGLVDHLGAAPDHAWIWRADRTRDVFSRAFDLLVADNYGDLPGTPADDDVDMLRRAVELLDRLLPRSSRSALRHTHLVAVFPSSGVWATRSSSSEFRLSGTIFVSQRLLANVWWAAEHIYHESLHQQLYDFRQGHSLLRPDFDRDDAPTICSLWNLPDETRGNFWDVHRTLAAYHVYVHLFLLATAAEDPAAEVEASFGPVRMTSSRTALDRALYLGEQLRGPFRAELGPAGQELVRWLGAVLASVDPSPPPPGAHVHLLMDRYRREAKEVAFLTSEGVVTEGELRLEDLIDDELASVRQALEMTDATEAIGYLEDASAELFDRAAGAFVPGRAPGVQFARARFVISEAVKQASHDGFTLAPDRRPDAIVEAMVEGSSLRIMEGVHGHAGPVASAP